MHHPFADDRLQAALDRRLDSAPSELRAVTTASAVEFTAPEFRLTAEQHAAVERVSKHVAEARAAYRGCRGDEDESGAEAMPPGSVLAREDRAAMLTEAIVEFDRASRRLRQSGLTLSARVTDETGRGLAEVSFRRAGA